MLKSMKVNEFIEELGSSSPAPGGGSTAALSSSLAASLCSMVFKLTIGKKAYLAYDEEIKNKILSADNLVESEKIELLNFMDKDADCFMKLMAAFKLPKETKEELEYKNIEILNGTKEALFVPLKLAEETFQLFPAIEVAAVYGNKNAVSDAGVAAIMACSAVEGAILNVKINLNGISEEDFVLDQKKKCDEILKNTLLYKEKIMKIVNAKIGD